MDGTLFRGRDSKHRYGTQMCLLIICATVPVRGGISPLDPFRAASPDERDLREAYQRVLKDLDEGPVETEQAMVNVMKALLAGQK